MLPGECQRKDGRFQFSKMVNGKRVTIYDWSLSELRDREALVFENAKNQLSKRKNKSKNKRSSFKEWFLLWLRHHTSDVKPTTRSRYYYDFSSCMEPIIGTIPIDEITGDDCQRVIDYALDKRGINSVKSCVLVMKKCLQTAKRHKLIERNPLDEVKMPTGDSKQRTAIPKEDLVLLRDFAYTEYTYRMVGDLLTILINTGMRIGELLSLTFDDIDFDNNKIRINKTIHYCRVKGKNRLFLTRPKTDTSERFIPMNPTCRKAVESQIGRAKRSCSRPKSVPFLDDLGNETDRIKGFIYVRENTSTPYYGTMIASKLRACQKRYNAYAKKHGLRTIDEFSLHQLRHTYTSEMYDSGVDVLYASEILGHKNVQTTINIYTHLTEEKKKDETNKLQVIEV